MASYLTTFAVLALFAIFHLTTAGNAARSVVCGKSGLSHGAYTAVRAIVSLTLLVASVWILLLEAQSTTLLFTPLRGVPAILPAMFAFGLAGTALSQVAKANRVPQFFGFQEFPKLFIYTGAYTVCRHPMYAAWLLAGWGLLLSRPYLLTVFYMVLLTGLVIYMAWREERSMVALFGDKYRAYQRQIPFLLPYGFLKPSVRKEGRPKL